MAVLVPHGKESNGTPSRGGSPTLAGELEATRFRIAFATLSIAAVGFMWGVDGLEAGTQASLLGTLLGWLCASLLALLLVRRSVYRPWMSYVSVGADLAFATSISFAIMAARNFNFTSGMLDAVSFVMILLAGVRRSAALVVVTAVVAAVANLIVSGLFFGSALSLNSVYLHLDGRVVAGVSFVDNITKAICMVIVGWLVAFVTRSLRRLERHYQELFESIPDGIAIADANGAVVTVNRRFLSMLGADDGAAVTGAPLVGYFDIGLGSGSTGLPLPSSALAGRKTHLKRLDGTRFPVRIATAPMRLRSGDGTVVSVRDESARKHMEEELSESRKMDSIGRLAGGLAHDFNNILGGILGATSVAALAARRIEGEAGRRISTQIELIADSGRAARDVVKKLLDFSRTEELTVRSFSLPQLLSDVATLCRKALGSSVAIEVSCEATGNLFVDGDEGALKQAFLSLCLKAGDAMIGGGRIRLAVEDGPSTRSFYASHPDAAVDVSYLCASITDDVPRDGAATPDSGAGGDPALQALARKHRGFIDTAAGAGKGVRVRMYLPRAKEPVAALQAAAAREERP